MQPDSTQATERGVLDPGRGGGPVFDRAVVVDRVTSRPDIDRALADLHAHKQAFVDLHLRERIALLDELRRDFAAIGERWADAGVRAKGIPAGSSRIGEEWGPFSIVLRLMRLFQATLVDLERTGRPRLPGEARRTSSGQLAVPVFPLDAADRVFYAGVTAEIWLEPGTTRAQLDDELGAAYRGATPSPKVALVLGAGNYSNLGAGDVLYKLFAERQVVVFKTNPVNAYLGPLIEEGLGALVRRGFLRVVYGGGEEGAYLAHHPAVDELHLTGSDKTYEAIVFGVGDEGRRRKAERQPISTKRFTCELGNVSPTIVVPGPWSRSDLAYQAEHIASTLTLNGGFNCLSTRVILQHRSWPEREALLAAIREVFARTPTRRAYYPGAARIHEVFLSAHPEAERIGRAPEGHLPWTLVADVDPGRHDDPCFRTEAFCSLFAETALEAPDPAAFLDAAVDFANERLWGTLTSTILVHPASLRDPRVAAALERAIAGLRYGTVGVNQWGAMGFLLGPTTWGAFPGHPSHDIQSGSGTVNNTLMVPRACKSVIRGPFRQRPKPPVFVSHATAPELFRLIADFEARRSPWTVPRILWQAMRG